MGSGWAVRRTSDKTSYARRPRRDGSGHTRSDRATSRETRSDHGRIGSGRVRPGCIRGLRHQPVSCWPRTQEHTRASVRCSRMQVGAGPHTRAAPAGCRMLDRAPSASRLTSEPLAVCGRARWPGRTSACADGSTRSQFRLAVSIFAASPLARSKPWYGDFAWRGNPRGWWPISHSQRYMGSLLARHVGSCWSSQSQRPRYMGRLLGRSLERLLAQSSVVHGQEHRDRGRQRAPSPTSMSGPCRSASELGTRSRMHVGAGRRWVGLRRRGRLPGRSMSVCRSAADHERPGRRRKSLTSQVNGPASGQVNAPYISAASELCTRRTATPAQVTSPRAGAESQMGHERRGLPPQAEVPSWGSSGASRLRAFAGTCQVKSRVGSAGCESRMVVAGGACTAETATAPDPATARGGR